VAKLIREGYTGYLIRTTNDDHAGRGASLGEVILTNEKDNEKVARVLGLEKVYDLGYRNHRMDNISVVELRIRGVPSDKEIGKAYGIEWTERFHYIGPRESKLEDYIRSQRRS
jgi:hypothetical protein